MIDDNFKVSRDTTSRQRQKPDQAWEIKSLPGGTVYLKFPNNSFRRHFLLPSDQSKKNPDKPPTAPEEKLKHKVEKRHVLSLNAGGRQAFGHGGNASRQALVERYTRGAQKHTIIDCNVTDLNTVLTTIAATFVDVENQAKEGTGWTGQQSVSITFKQACVKNLTASGQTPSEFKVTPETPINVVTISATRLNDRTFSIEHVTA